MKLFDFLFYCLYRVFKLIPRQGVKDEDLASFLYFVLLATNTDTVFLFFKNRASVEFFKSHSFLARLVFLLPFVFWYFFCKYYFSKKGKGQFIIGNYEGKYHNANGKFVFLGIIYTVVTFSLFITIATLLSRKH